LFLIRHNHRAVRFRWESREKPALHVSPAIVQFGYSPKDFLSGRILYQDIIYAEDRDDVRRQWLYHLETGAEHWECDYRIVSGRGELLWVSEHVTPVWRRQGEPVCFDACVTDITKLRDRVAESVRNTLESEFRLTLQNLQNVIFKYRKENQRLFYTLYEGKIARELGLTTETTFGKTLHEIFSAEDAEYLSRFYHKAFDEGVTVDYEFQYAGRVFYNVLSPVFKNGKVVEVVGSAVDITDRKQAEIELEKARDEVLVASRMKSEFMATMSHEIRTPMNAMIGMLNQLHRSPLNAEQRQFTRIIHEATRTLLNLINDILDFSKAEAGKIHLEHMDFDLFSLVEGAAELMAPKAHEKNDRITTFVDPNLPSLVRGDPGRIRQILLNLLDNAIKFTDGGEIAVSARLISQTNTHANVLFSVTDTGSGISKPVQQRLFQPFTQGDSSITRKYGGTGLGLSIAKRLVELMNGDIGLESKENQGSTFWFALPLPYDHTVRSKVDDLTKAKVLFIKQPDMELTTICQYLHLYGIETAAAGNFPQAVEFLKEGRRRKKPYPFVIVDSLMGLEHVCSFSRRIKSDPVLFDTHVIVLLDCRQEEWKDRAQKAGVTAFLTRPVKQSQFIYLLSNLCGMREKCAADEKAPKLCHNPALANSGKRVLIVDDNAVNQQVVAIHLQNLGLTTHAVSTGAEAVDAVRSQHFDLVLMDIQMPEMSGYDAAREIRRIELLKSLRIPVIALTANAVGREREECLAAGMDDFLTKPFCPEQIEKIIRRWLPGFPGQKRGQNADKLKKWLSVNPVDADQLIETFTVEHSKLLEIIFHSLEKRERNTFAKAVHKAKSGAAFMGAGRMAELLERLEATDPRAKKTEAIQLYREIERELLAFGDQCSLAFKLRDGSADTSRGAFPYISLKTEEYDNGAKC
jgi:polar amino acid transport system substrate-binding protein